MRKILLLMSFIIMAGCDGKLNLTPDELVQPVSYEIDGWGSNPDIYEFTPKGNERYFCMLAVSGGDDLKSIFCMPKENKKP